MPEQQTKHTLDCHVNAGTAKPLTATSGGVWGATRITVGTLIMICGPGVILPHRTHAGNTVIYRHVVRVVVFIDAIVFLG